MSYRLFSRHLIRLVDSVFPYLVLAVVFVLQRIDSRQILELHAGLVTVQHHPVNAGSGGIAATFELLFLATKESLIEPCRVPKSSYLRSRHFA